MKKILSIIGARPQFIKHFPLDKAAKGRVNLISIHTGQHYDENMSQVFFDEFGMSKPDYQLSIGSKSHGDQTGEMLIQIEKIILEEKPDGVLVYGDTNSTLAGALAAAKLNIPIIHIEAGLRSYNKSMPEEINRVLTDHVSTLLFVPSQSAVKNLHKEGIAEGIYDVGDIMKDLVLYCTRENKLKNPETINEEYYYATLHRPYNTDSETRLEKVLNALNSLGKTVVFTIHPRTRNLMEKYGFEEDSYTNIKFIDPQPYFSNLSYLQKSQGLITDSGGMQKEAYWLEKKCVTIRTETEWVETLEGQANHLVFDDLDEIEEIFSLQPTFDSELYGDGSAASKILEIIQKTEL